MRGVPILAILGVTLLLPVLYLFSAGPMTPLLNHSGDSGYLAWQTIYGEPLGRLPRPLRQIMNRYIGYCDKTYYRLKRMLQAASLSPESKQFCYDGLLAIPGKELGFDVDDEPSIG